ncbi:MAG: Rpp14/Pop5 family protein [Candidatus Bilamarchaeaceae archaeon]
MTKAVQLKKRYVLFKYAGPETDQKELEREVRAQSLKFFGEYGTSFLMLKLEHWDPSKKEGAFRVERSKCDEFLGFLALVRELKGQPAHLESLKTSGMLGKFAGPKKE